MKVEEQITPINEYELHIPKLYVAIYYYTNSRTPFGITSDTKEGLLQSLKNWRSIDETKPVKIFTLHC
jgi:hypothetical protein